MTSAKAKVAQSGIPDRECGSVAFVDLKGHRPANQVDQLDELRLVEVKDGLAWYPAPSGLRLGAVEAGSVLTPLA